MGNMKIGAFYVDRNLTGRLYWQLVEEAIAFGIVAAIENDADLNNNCF